MTKQRLAVTGANGYIASLVRLYNGQEYDIVPVTRHDVDFSDPGAVRAFFEGLDFDIVFHTAAVATTALCENEPELTHRINVESPIELATVCGERGKRLVFITTEQTFNAKTEGAPFAESAEPESHSHYGRQKTEVDAWLATSDVDYVTLRLSWMFGLPMPGVKPSPNVALQVLDAIRTHEPASFKVHDRRGLTYAQLLAEKFPRLARLPRGQYNVSSETGLTPYGAARYLAAALGADDELVAQVILPDLESYADAPRDYRLDTEKLAEQGISFGTFEENVARMMRDFGYPERG
ncbi:sugar nucleotide-binding protein [Olsenella sp. YH-ols2217]|uniref:dTDP-4-dehydrorhamnose reductase n=1 Tax=Kribbibacterium absianum TaxID=3044210 RepID=A0ABT6ZL15_9ACTN|nr:MULTISPECIES: sugar nucleotide-binding protein [unclassified Olsenella]MDJ1121735.1 sugar nucleotide-binding protein [Olsenella sp. YH-ols2216]MDJ1129743.1 sugar nucleotide-binding protein [Olsenella sp. YH-ols2217]